MCSGIFTAAGFVNSQKLEINQMSINSTTGKLLYTIHGVPYSNDIKQTIPTSMSQCLEKEERQKEYILCNYIYVNFKNRQN